MSVQDSHPGPHLLRHPVFASMPPELLRMVEPACELRSYAERERITAAGRARRHVVLVATGSLEAHRRTALGGSYLCGLYSAPNLLGDEDDEPSWSVSTFALEPTVTVWIDQQVFSRAVGLDPGAQAALCRDVRVRTRAQQQIAAIFACREARDRILQLLWLLATPSKAPDETACVRVSRAHLARSLASDRKTIERTLKRLEAEGYVRTNGKRIGLLGDQRELRTSPALTSSASSRAGVVPTGCDPGTTMNAA